jgi:hypothetical protein
VRQPPRPQSAWPVSAAAQAATHTHTSHTCRNSSTMRAAVHRMSSVLRLRLSVNSEANTWRACVCVCVRESQRARAQESGLSQAAAAALAQLNCRTPQQRLSAVGCRRRAWLLPIGRLTASSIDLFCSVTRSPSLRPSSRLQVERTGGSRNCASQPQIRTKRHEMH